MTIHWACACGKRAQSKAVPAGKQVRCPACGGPMRRVAASDSHSSSPDLQPDDDLIRVICLCGARFKAKPELAGRHVPCPTCGSELIVPAGGGPSGAPAELSPLDDILAEVPDPLGATTGGALRSHAPQPKSMDRTKVVIIACCAGAALVLLVVGLIALDSSSDSSDLTTVAQQPAPSYPPPPSPQASAGSAPTGSPAQRAPSEPAAPVSDPATAEPGPAATEVPNRPSSDTQRTRLGPAIELWRGSAGASLRGATPAGDDKTIMAQYSWMTQLLPHLGYEKVYHGLSFERPWTEKRNATLATLVIPEFLNPGDDRERWKGLPLNGLGLTHFVGVSGLDEQDNPAATLPRTDPRAGVFGYEEVARPEQITDGTSNTVMVVGAGELVGPWVAGGGATVRGAREPYFDEVTGFGTKGSEPGTFALFADGSTRFISKNIDPKVFRSLCTIHGGESIDLDDIGKPNDHFPTKRNP